MFLALPSVARAGDPLADVVRDAVAAGNLRETDLQGNAAAPAPYRDGVSDGSVLVGLEIGLGGERVVSLRPLYRAGGRDRTGLPAGRFLSDDVIRTVRLTARPGYAVTGLSVSAGRRLEGLALRFARIDRAGLNPADAYESPWVGSGAANTRVSHGEGGQPVVGMFGRLEGDAIVAVGLVIADLPRTVAPPVAAPSALVAAPVPTSALEREKPTKYVAAGSSGGRVWALVVLAGVILTAAGVVYARARRRKPRGVQQLPRLPSLRRPGASLLEGPPSIPGNVVPGLLGTTTPPPAHQPTRLDSDFVWR
jgi:hypothetical protein